MLAKYLTAPILKWATASLGIALLTSLAFGWLQTSRLSAARAVVVAADRSVKLLVERVNSDRQLIASRDQLIEKQNRAVLAIHKAAEADRARYLTRIAAAEKVAVAYEANAKAIMARQLTTTDELERSRAALALIKEMINVHP